MIQVWAFERDYNTKYEIQDAMIPWKTKDNKIYNRYYYLFKKNELDKMINLNKVELIRSYKERDNYIIIFKKQ